MVLAFDRWVGAAPTEWKGIDKILFSAACEFLRASWIMRPCVLDLLEHVATARDRVEVETWDWVSTILSFEQRWVLDELLVLPDRQRAALQDERPWMHA